jgi:hypothetical protein
MLRDQPVMAATIRSDQGSGRRSRSIAAIRWMSRQRAKKSATRSARTPETRSTKATSSPYRARTISRISGSSQAPRSVQAAEQPRSAADQLDVAGSDRLQREPPPLAGGRPLERFERLAEASADGGLEEVLLRSEQPEDIGLRDSDAARDLIGGGTLVPMRGKRDQRYLEHGFAPLRRGEPGRGHLLGRAGAAAAASPGPATTSNGVLAPHRPAGTVAGDSGVSTRFRLQIRMIPRCDIDARRRGPKAAFERRDSACTFTPFLGNRQRLDSLQAAAHLPVPGDPVG